MPRLSLTYASCKYDRIEAQRSGEVPAEGIPISTLWCFPPDGRFSTAWVEQHFIPRTIPIENLFVPVSGVGT